MSLDKRVVSAKWAESFPTGEDLLQVTALSPDETAMMVAVGEIDICSVHLLYERLAEIIEEAKADLIVDLERVSFMDARGLTFLLATHHELMARGARLVVLSPSRQVRRIFDVCGLTSQLVVVPREGEAESLY